MKEYINDTLDELEFNESDPLYKMCQFYNVSVKDDNGNFKYLLEVLRELSEKIK